jgi:hypothetical protein
MVMEVQSISGDVALVVLCQSGLHNDRNHKSLCVVRKLTVRFLLPGSEFGRPVVISKLEFYDLNFLCYFSIR